MEILELMKNLNTVTAEEALYGVNKDPAFEAVKGPKPIYDEYDVDLDMTLKLREFLNFSGRDVYTINAILNRDAKVYAGESTRCPVCGKALDLVGNNGHFCKFCGTHIKKNVGRKFGDVLKDIRKKKGIGQTELGRLMNNSASYVCNLENGKRIPTVQDLAKLTRIFNCSVNILFGQPAPREKSTTNLPEEYITYQGNLPSKEEKPVIKEECIGGYLEDEEYIYKCPHCKKEVDLTPLESLSLGLPSYEVMKIRSHGNDGTYCKYCGQRIKRPVEIDKNKAASAYQYWIDYAKGFCGNRNKVA